MRSDETMHNHDNFQQTMQLGCSYCGRTNHNSADCRAFKQGINCSFCGHEGHIVNYCRDRFRGQQTFPSNQGSGNFRPQGQEGSNQNGDHRQAHYLYMGSAEGSGPLALEAPLLQIGPPEALERENALLRDQLALMEAQQAQYANVGC
jgi:hypothetical protein